DRTYLWEDVDATGAEIHLSNVNIINPSFTSPSVTTQTIYRYVLRTNRLGTCLNYDTLTIVVNPLPENFTTTDTLLCTGITYALVPNIYEADINYTIWDAVSGGNYLGNSPLNT